MPSHLPDRLAGRLAGYRTEPVEAGESGAVVIRLTPTGTGSPLYLKSAAGAAAAAELAAETMRLRWLASRVPAPTVVDWVTEPDRAWLLMTALPGATAAAQLERAAPAEQGAIVAALAALLNRLQALPIASCPFDASDSRRLDQARARIDAGQVDPADFDAERAGWTPEQVWAALRNARPTRTEPVVSHGDFTLENVVIAPDGRAGCIDVGRLGVADRYQDIALAWRGLADHGAALQRRFLQAVAADPVDAERLRFHLLLDELF
ncbi:APH(3') family aminoglycoside O-phosphotransferase [Novosphingobium piscinae]|uniref:Aminoglycoside 3'-phosphotransferase n=1 Tax=Novosphingobium piscinae TaxID=1507448 RepID=A0A7X1FY73_9SPHN|nr:APH(3') family aminoglycoside O-phosphotransferase [Novosphingobium piscinae]MBC2669160.1 aminoglycoside 3'-phosphotransferase [Novosphingobium piscinae]